jgi:signal transduction histidine kinase
MQGPPGRSGTSPDEGRPSSNVADFSPRSSTAPVYRILVLVSHRRNRRLLVDWCADQPSYDVLDGVAAIGDEWVERRTDERWDGGTEGVPPEWRPPTEVTQEAGEVETPEPDSSTGIGRVDLVLVDVAALGTYERWLSNRFSVDRRRSVPCLLLGSENTVRRFFGAENGHPLRHLIDDAVTTPVDPALLDRRVRAYLRIGQQSAEIERRQDQLSLLAQVLRHDIANAATVITGWGDALRGDVEPDGIEALERVLRAGQRITELVENSRDLTRLIETGHRLDTRAMPLAPVLEREVETIERVHESTSTGVVVTLETPPPTVDVIAGGMLPSVFANLFSNAVRHNDAGETEIDVSVGVEPATVVVRVRDNGPGVPDDRKEEVFEPSTKSVDSPGDGLGLSLVRRLVDSYGGEIWFEDASGGGAVACVELRRVADH